MLGTVVTFDWRKGSGEIALRDTNQRVPVQAADLALRRGFLVEGEEVSFDLAETTAGGQAINVVLACSAKRWTGTVLMFENGCGFIRADGRRDDIFVHHTSVLGAGPQLLGPGEPVEFELVQSGTAHTATKVVRLEKRGELERFADWVDLDANLAILAGVARSENWESSRSGGDAPRIVLKHYIQDTFAQVEEQGKIAVATEMSGRPIASFNTGLVTGNQEELYGYFEGNPGAKAGQKWIFRAFCTAADPRLYHFAALPAPATYYARGEELVFDPGRVLMVDYAKVTADVILHSHSGQTGHMVSSRQILEEAVKSSLVRVKRNYKTAVPMYYNRAIRLLLPLCLQTHGKADLALVIERNNKEYGASSVLPLNEAYRYARLLARPDNDWLVP